MKTFIDSFVSDMFKDGGQLLEKGNDFVKFNKNGVTYVLERIGKRILLWRSTMLMMSTYIEYCFNPDKMKDNDIKSWAQRILSDTSLL